MAMNTPLAGESSKHKYVRQFAAYRAQLQVFSAALFSIVVQAALLCN